MTTPSDAPCTSEVAILADRFEPSAVVVDAGSAVTWTNRDAGDHTVSSAEIESGVVPVGERFRHTFDSPGRYRYFCMLHPRTVGVVIVR